MSLIKLYHHITTKADETARRALPGCRFLREWDMLAQDSRTGGKFYHVRAYVTETHGILVAVNGSIAAGAKGKGLASRFTLHAPQDVTRAGHDLIARKRRDGYGVPPFRMPWQQIGEQDFLAISPVGQMAGYAPSDPSLELFPIDESFMPVEEERVIHVVRHAVRALGDSVFSLVGKPRSALHDLVIGEPLQQGWLTFTRLGPDLWHVQLGRAHVELWFDASGEPQFHNFHFKEAA